MTEINAKWNASSSEINRRAQFLELFRANPIAQNELLDNLALFTRRQTLTNTLFMNDLYQRLLPVNGVIFEFGVRWGKNLALYENLRGIYEPFNHTRRIVGFDTFEGFPSVDVKDGTDKVAAPGAYSVTKGYETYLTDVLEYHESESPIAHIRKFELVKGDATVTVPDFLRRHPETIVAMAYFDFDIYAPTKACLEAIIPHLTKGSILAFDELNYPVFPGETVALREVLGTNKLRIQRSPFGTYQSFAVWGE